MQISARPLFNRLIIKPIPDKEVTRGGVIIPGVGDRPARGEVVAHGPETISKVGDTILYNRNAGVDVDVEEGLFKSMLETPHEVYVIL